MPSFIYRFYGDLPVWCFIAKCLPCICRLPLVELLLSSNRSFIAIPVVAVCLSGQGTHEISVHYVSLGLSIDQTLLYVSRVHLLPGVRNFFLLIPLLHSQHSLLMPPLVSLVSSPTSIPLLQLLNYLPAPVLSTSNFTTSSIFLHHSVLFQFTFNYIYRVPIASLMPAGYSNCAFSSTSAIPSSVKSITSTLISSTAASSYVLP